MAQRHYRLRPDEFRPLAEGRGYCFATVTITVDGLPVGFMYREPPNEPADSGWRFFAGDDTDEYANAADNLELYDVNTVANYDPQIIPWLDTPYPVALERDASGTFVEVDMPTDAPD